MAPWPGGLPPNSSPPVEALRLAFLSFIKPTGRTPPVRGCSTVGWTCGISGTIFPDVPLLESNGLAITDCN